nr:hypothetical protein [Tanacetum cinerariifolium]
MTNRRWYDGGSMADQRQIGGDMVDRVSSRESLESKEALLARAIEENKKYPGSFSRSLSRVQVSTMAVKDDLIVAGGFHGELICKYLNKPGVSFATKIATDETAITNSVDISYSSSGAMRLMTANNDTLIRVFDAKSFTCVDNFSFPWCVNSKVEYASHIINLYTSCSMEFMSITYNNVW